MKILLIITLPLLILLSSCENDFQKLNKEDNTYKLSTIEQLQDNEYAQKIETFYNNGAEGNFVGKADISIYYKIFKQKNNEKSAILISTGRTEAAIKYKELIFDLYNNGYSVYIHDHRGQGLSGRMVEDHDMGYIDTFQFYIDDMKYFYDNLLLANNHDKIYLLSHSMGGAIAMTYLEQYANDFKAAAFSSPMLGLTKPSCSVVKILTGEDVKYALGQGVYDDDEIPFEENNLTGSKDRYTRMIDAFEKEPKAKLGGATYQWIYKSCQQFKYINANISNIETPLILFSGSDDNIVDTYAHQKFIDNAKKNNKLCMAYVVDNAKHELFIEKDEQRIETINEVLKFYDKFK
ncbi:MAG: alpha/beta fold hydrolase [Bacteroidales bacterium]|nr:alpha/beta fold hydrolase [Bacteroidales bacterium]